MPEMRHVHPSLVTALKLDGETWAIGGPPVKVTTTSGAIYEVAPDGTMSGGSKNLNAGKLSGAIYAVGGPIRVNQIVVGLAMEYGTSDGRYGNSSPITKIEPA